MDRRNSFPIACDAPMHREAVAILEVARELQERVARFTRFDAADIDRATVAAGFDSHPLFLECGEWLSEAAAGFEWVLGQFCDVFDCYVLSDLLAVRIRAAEAAGHPAGEPDYTPSVDDKDSDPDTCRADDEDEPTPHIAR